MADLVKDDLLKTYAPHAYADYGTIPGETDLVTWPDGSISSSKSWRCG